jgi:hypothetical protein
MRHVKIDLEEIKYCDMIAWSVAGQRLDKRVSATTDMFAAIKDIVGYGVFYKVRAEAIL